MSSLALPADSPAARSTGRALLLTLPIALFGLLMFSPTLMLPDISSRMAALTAWVFMIVLFFIMMKTSRTYRWRRVFFVALGFLFPIGFIWDLIAVRASMSIPIERMISGDTPFCFMVIPMTIIPAALAKTIIFPGSILPTPSNPHAIATMVALWLAATIVLGKAWCSYGCFFGGLEEGFSAIAKRPRIKNINPRWRLLPWAVLVAIVLLSAATLEPTYCTWLCPFKTVTEFAEVRTAEAAVQTGIFLSLFFGLVVTLPILTKRRTQCAFFCPFGAFQSLFNKTNVFDIRIDREKCRDCDSCEKSCPTLALDQGSIRQGRTLMSCMHCGACVDACKKNAAVWHIKGTPVGARPETARLLHLYAAWGFATMFGGSIIASSLEKLYGLLI
jgi:ferredoxin-type protein NapH